MWWQSGSEIRKYLVPMEAESTYAVRELGMGTLGWEMLTSFRLLYLRDTTTTEEAQKLQLIPAGENPLWDTLMELTKSPTERKLPTASHTSKALMRWKLTTHAGASWKSGGTAKCREVPFIVLANPPP